MYTCEGKNNNHKYRSRSSHKECRLKKNKQLTLKTFAPFTDYISEKNNTPVDNAKDLHVVMLMYNLIVYCNNYTKTSGSSRQYQKDVPNDNITIFEVKITGRTPTDSDRKDI